MCSSCRVRCVVNDTSRPRDRTTRGVADGAHYAERAGVQSGDVLEVGDPAD